MITTSDIYPVSDFNRKPAEHIRRLQETRRPEILTVNGKAAVVMIDPESYDQLSQELELARSLTLITKANAQFENGEGIPVAEGFARMKEILKIKYPDEEI